jgi:hypothetical protein
LAWCDIERVGKVANVHQLIDRGSSSCAAGAYRGTERWDDWISGGGAGSLASVGSESADRRRIARETHMPVWLTPVLSGHVVVGLQVLVAYDRWPGSDARIRAVHWTPVMAMAVWTGCYFWALSEAHVLKDPTPIYAVATPASLAAAAGPERPCLREEWT